MKENEAKQPSDKQLTQIREVMGKSAVKILKYCAKSGFDNPAFILNIDVTTGEKYVMKFERVDLDNQTQTTL